MKLKDRQTIFDAVLETYGTLDGLFNVVQSNDDIFASELNGLDKEPINKNVAIFLQEKQVITY